MSKQIEDTSRAVWKKNKDGTIEIFDGVGETAIIDVWKNPSVLGRNTEILASDICNMLNGYPKEEI